MYPRCCSTLCLTKPKFLLSVCLCVSVRKVSVLLLRRGREKKLVSMVCIGSKTTKYILSFSWDLYFFFIVFFV